MTRELDHSSSRPPTRLVFALRADDASVAHMARERIGTWLARHRWPAEESHDIVYAVSEAVTNVCEHAYGRQEAGPVEVTAYVEHPTAQTRRIRVAVTDKGRWRPRATYARTRGRGLGLIRAMMAGVRLQRGTDVEPGTSLILTSPPVPA